MAIPVALGMSGTAGAAVFVQCGAPANGYVVDGKIIAARDADALPDGVSCKHLSAGDGFISMADGRSLYTFGFTDVTKKAASEVVLDSLAAQFSAPTIRLKQDQEFYLTLTNVCDGHAARPVRPAHGALPRLSATGTGVRRHARGLVRGQHGLDRSPTSSSSTTPAHTCTTATRRRPSTCRWACSAICT